MLLYCECWPYHMNWHLTMCTLFAHAFTQVDYYFHNCSLSFTFLQKHREFLSAFVMRRRSREHAFSFSDSHTHTNHYTFRSGFMTNNFPHVIWMCWKNEPCYCLKLCCKINSHYINSGDHKNYWIFWNFNPSNTGLH